MTEMLPRHSGMRGKAQTSDAQSRIVVLRFAKPRNDGIGSSVERLLTLPLQLPPVRRGVRLIDRKLVHRGLPEMLGHIRRLQVAPPFAIRSANARLSSASIIFP
jgi:ABC-type molybdate transport system permease subunit